MSFEVKREIFPINYLILLKLHIIDGPLGGNFLLIWPALCMPTLAHVGRTTKFQDIAMVI